MDLGNFCVNANYVEPWRVYEIKEKHSTILEFCEYLHIKKKQSVTNT